MSEQINLNSNEYDSGAIIIFNGGVAGEVEDVKIAVEKKGSDAKDNFPDYRLVVRDKDGGTITRGFYYLDPNADNFKERLIREGGVLRHLWHAVLGKDADIPPFKDTKEMLDTVFNTLRKAIEQTPDELYKVFTDYGSNTYPRKYMRISYFAPYIAKMTDTETKFVTRPGTRLTPFVEDSKEEKYEDVYTSEEPSKEEADAWSE